MGDLKGLYVRLLLLSAVLISALMHSPYLSKPPYGTYLNTQVSTLAIADNFFYEDNTIYLPRVDNRGISDGITGMHFPLYEYLVAQTYSYTGNHFIVHRLWSFLFSILGALAAYYLTRLWFRSEKAGLIAFYFFLFSPEVFYNGFIALPDIMALAFVLWGLVYFYQWWYKKKHFQLIFSVVLFLAGGLINLPYLGIGFVVVGTVLRDWKPLSKQDWLHLGTASVFVIFPVLLWYRYARMMIESSSKLKISFPLKTKNDFSENFSVFKQNLLFDIPNLILGYVAVLGLLMGFFYFIRKKNRTEHPLFLPFASFLGVISVYHFLEIRLVENHQHYLMPYLVFLIPVAAYGLLKLTKGRNKVWMSLLAVHILICGIQIMPTRFSSDNHGIADEFWNDEQRAELQKAIPSDSLIIVGPDPSSCIDFYFLKSQGWTFQKTEQLSGTQTSRSLPIDSMIRSGASYIVSNDSSVFQNPVVWSRLGELKAEVGKFKVFSLRQLRK